MKIKTVFPLSLVLIFCLALSSSALAYSLSGHKIGSFVTYRPERAIGSLSLTHMRSASSSWNSAARGTILTLGTAIDLGKYPNYDGINGVYKRDMSTTDYVALNTSWKQPSSKILLESDIVFNMQYPYANEPSPGSVFFDTYSIYLHEIGHTVGLSDLYSSSDSAKVMYGYVSPGTTKRTLHIDDINGAEHIYVFPGI